jgi:antirestriction protein ArdC
MVSNQERRKSGKSRKAALRAARGDTPRVSLYDDVTATIIAQLEAGVFPWVQPWSASAAGIGLPRNAVSGRSYSGINVLILWGAVIAGGYASQDWLTFRQALAEGGCVLKGEHGQTIFYADRFIPKGEHEQGREASDTDTVRSIPFLKRFTVFNVSQCEGLPERFTATPAPLPERQPHDEGEALIAATRADFRIGGPEAFYSPALDFVQAPPQPAFAQQIDYYRTALHELGHWTGHPLICLLLGGPRSMLFWTRKGKTNAIQETHAGGDYRQAARGGNCAGAGRDDQRCVPPVGDQRADLLPLAQGIWRPEDRSSAADERP